MRAFPPRLSGVQKALTSKLMLLGGTSAPSPWGPRGALCRGGVGPRGRGEEKKQRIEHACRLFHTTFNANLLERESKSRQE